MNGHLLPRGVLLGILGGDVPPGSPNPDPISDRKMSFFTSCLLYTSDAADEGIV